MLNKYLLKISLKLFPSQRKYKGYLFLIWKNKLKKIFYKKSDYNYLFILSPPFCGSTLLNEILSTSSHVSTNNNYGTREGQTLPTVRKHMYDIDNRWTGSKKINWFYVKKEWLKYWDVTKKILLEKSPPNIQYANDIKQYFKPSKFIIFHRNPYAHCVSLMKRAKMNPTKAAEFSIKCLRYQMHNINNLDDKIVISYEDLTEQTESTKAIINNFFEQVDLDIKTNIKFNAHNFKKQKMKIQNLNQEKIQTLSKVDLLQINEIFKNNVELIEYFGYKIIRV